MGFSNTNLRPVLNALREAIRDDIWEIKVAHPTREIHHVVPFHEIVLLFFNKYSEASLQTHHLPNGGYQLTNEAIKNEWVTFHRHHAQLQPLSHDDHRTQHTRSSYV